MFSKERIEKLNSSRLADVKPELAEKCRAIIAQAASESFTLIVTQGFRSIEEQNKLYQIGRRGIPGEKRVTNARSGQSNHNYREAADFVFIFSDEISWNEKLYQNLGRWTQKVGLKWGGNWKLFKDFPHVEL